MNTALNHIPSFVASEAADEFNEDPVACIEAMIKADTHQKLRMVNDRWISDWINTAQHDLEVANIRTQERIALAQVLKEIISESWQSNDVRESGQYQRDLWLDKWVAFQGGRS